jgi:hypothetical protein
MTPEARKLAENLAKFEHLQTSTPKLSLNSYSRRVVSRSWQPTRVVRSSAVPPGQVLHVLQPGQKLPPGAVVVKLPQLQPLRGSNMKQGFMLEDGAVAAETTTEAEKTETASTEAATTEAAPTETASTEAATTEEAPTETATTEETTEGAEATDAAAESPEAATEESGAAGNSTDTSEEDASRAALLAADALPPQRTPNPDPYEELKEAMERRRQAVKLQEKAKKLRRRALGLQVGHLLSIYVSICLSHRFLA